MKILLIALFCVSGVRAFAMDLDWSGFFRAENHWISNYTMDSGAAFRDTGRENAGGYYTPSGGATSAHFQTLFLKLRPKVIVNDNIYIKSEWWVGDPIYGFFGSGVPYAADQHQYNSTFSRGSSITAQRLWGEFLSDIGTIQVGRAPLNWGLGIVWSAGDGISDRYASTGDMVRLQSKFGAFSFVPAIIKYSSGNSVAGGCDWSGTACTNRTGGANVTDLSIALKFENPDDDLEGGVNFIRRIGGANQDSDSGFLGIVGQAQSVQTAVSLSFNTWDIYAKKRLGKLSFGIEAPIVSGTMGVAGASMDYKTFALALESEYKFNDTWDLGLKMGYAPGQPNLPGFLNVPTRFKAFYFNQNYKPALIMFNYQLANFAGPNTQNDPTITGSSLKSPYDNPIVNARYLSLKGGANTGRWRIHTTWTFAKANEIAAQGVAFYNTIKKRFYFSTQRQDSSMGWEMDYGTVFSLDDTFKFGADMGFFFPGDYYHFSNTTNMNPTGMVFASVLKATVEF